MVSSAPDAQRMAQPPALERLLRRDGAITLAGVLVLCALAWLYLLAGAGLGIGAWEATTLALFPHQHAPASMPGMDMPAMDMSAPTWTAATWLLVVGMWWAMMIAMMTPSAAPTILLHARVHRHALAQGQLRGALAPSGRFVAGYLIA
jgi:predicted metal-binding membrane protein